VSNIVETVSPGASIAGSLAIREKTNSFASFSEIIVMSFDDRVVIFGSWRTERYEKRSGL
jgi:hypothetical protein